MPSFRTLFTQFILLVLVAATWWLAENLTTKEEVVAKVDDSQVDYYSKNIRRIALTPEGTPKDVLVAATMTHYKNDDHTDMDKPVMTMYKKLGEEPWVIRSERSTSLAGGDTVLLRGKVLVTREGQKNGGLKIVTSNVKYIPDKDYAETRENVLMLSKDDETSATGAQVYFEPVLKINLLADVRRKHETQ